MEAKLLNRNAIGIDVNSNAVELAKRNIEVNIDNNSSVICKTGNACKLSLIENESIDMICTHPPYANIIKYSDGIDGDISVLNKDDFISKMRIVAGESYRVLKNGKICAFMIGDIRKNGNVVPLGFEVMQLFKDVGFVNKEIIIKEQHNCRSTDYWMKKKRDFLMLAHEYIFVMKK